MCRMIDGNHNLWMLSTVMVMMVRRWKKDDCEGQSWGLLPAEMGKRVFGGEATVSSSSSVEGLPAHPVAALWLVRWVPILPVFPFLA